MIVVNEVLIQQFDDYSERVSVHPHAYEEIAHVFSSNVSPDATAWGKTAGSISAPICATTLSGIP